MSTSRKPDKRLSKPRQPAPRDAAKDEDPKKSPDRQDEPLDENSLERVMRDAPL